MTHHPLYARLRRATARRRPHNQGDPPAPQALPRPPDL